MRREISVRSPPAVIVHIDAWKASLEVAQRTDEYLGEKIERIRCGGFTPDEVSRLLSTAASSPFSFPGLSSPDRVILYKLALASRFRA